MATTQEYGLGEFTFPRGWFMIAEASELQDKPLALRYFAHDYVLYRGQSGRVFLVDAYCPHMRVHLAKNSTSYVVRDGHHVEGDSIRCPGHGWRFDGKDGGCDDIPYSLHGIPKAARLKTYTVVERAGCIWMWHDSEGGEPEFDLPAFAEWDKPGWVRWRIDHLGRLPIHPQEILDNMADYAHFVPVHGSNDVRYFANEFRDHVIRQHFIAGHRTLVSEDATLETDTWYTGPGILQSRMQGRHPSLIMICNTPVEDGMVQVWHALMVHVGEDVPPETATTVARGYQDTALAAFSQDFELWANKEAAVSVLQIPDDGPFHKERIWHRQFYNRRDRADEFRKRVNGTHVTVDHTAIAAE